VAFDEKDRGLAQAALLAEQEFAWSLIRTYREFQMQAVGFAVALDAAVLAVIGSAIESGNVLPVVAYCTALLPFPTAILVLAFAVMEVRICRASRHSVLTLAPKLEALRVRRAGSSGPLLLEWEIHPGRHLSPLERNLSNSAVFVCAMSLPALAGAMWHVFAGTLQIPLWQPELAVIGAILLILAGALTAGISIGHEGRR
jgi:hypothetical protein